MFDNYGFLESFILISIRYKQANENYKEYYCDAYITAI